MTYRFDFLLSSAMPPLIGGACPYINIALGGSFGGRSGGGSRQRDRQLKNTCLSLGLTLAKHNDCRQPKKRGFVCYNWHNRGLSCVTCSSLRNPLPKSGEHTKLQKSSPVAFFVERSGTKKVA